MNTIHGSTRRQFLGTVSALPLVRLLFDGENTKPKTTQTDDVLVAEPNFLLMHTREGVVRDEEDAYYRELSLYRSGKVHW